MAPSCGFMPVGEDVATPIPPKTPMSARPRPFARLLATLCLLLGAAIAHAQTIVATAAAGTEPRAVAVNPNTGRAYVANEFSNDVTVLDASGHVLSRVPVGKRPQYIAVNSRTNKVYVSNAQDATLSVIDGATLSVNNYMVSGSGPFLVDEAVNRIYMVRLGNADEVTYFNGNDNSFYTIALDSYSPVAISLNPYTARLYVATTASGDVRVVDTLSTSDYPPTLSVGMWSNAVGVSVNPATNRIYVVTKDPRGPIAVINGDSNAASFLTPAGHASGGTSVAANPFTNKAYYGFTGEIGILDGATNAVSFVPVSGTVGALKINFTSNRVYAITSNNELVTIDGTTNAVSVLPIPGGARDLAIDPVANLVYVVGSGGLTVVQGTGASGPTPSLPPPPATTYGFNVQGMWWGGEGESGWGLDLSHQGNKVFATWFTYDTDGQPMWLAMSDGWRNGDNAYTGDLYRMSGPPMNGPFDPAKVKATKVGAASLSFVDANNGNFTAQVNGVQFFRKITRFNYTPQGSKCTTGGAPGATNYQDLWWRAPAGSESGWGVFLTHQGDTLFFAWFTYGADGRPTWLLASNVAKQASGSYTGTLFRAVGPPFSASPWNAGQVKLAPVGTVALAFSDADNALLSYTVDTQSGTKSLTRFAFSTPKTVCQ